jgi:ABC-type multidrug transport system fused ATPase/permease subunit
LGAHDVLSGQLSPGQLLVMISYIAAAYAPLQTLTNSVTVLQQQFVAVNYAFDLLDQPAAPEGGAESVGRVRGELRVQDVSFAYTPGRTTLRDISFEVRAGEVLAIVGATGAGKTTLVNLLPRFYDAHEGTISIDGRDIREISLPSLRAQFALVLQEPLLFSQTIRANIVYGRPDASMEQIEQAARDANAHDFIRRLPNKYETRLGERGTKISVGERQRISVARAFLRDAPIVILDEPTSSIDSRTEAVILDALDRLMVGRTTIVIAHRLSTIRRADRVLVMDHGRIAQHGTHEELIAQEGPYRQLWSAQALQRVRLDAARAALLEVNAAAGSNSESHASVHAGGPA